MPKKPPPGQKGAPPRSAMSTVAEVFLVLTICAVALVGMLSFSKRASDVADRAFGARAPSFQE